MKSIIINLITITLISHLNAATSDTESIENIDLDFLPPAELYDTNNVPKNIDKQERNNSKLTLDNNYQVTKWKDQDDMIFKLPSKNQTNWSNLTRFEIRDELSLNPDITLKAEILINVFTRESDSFNSSDDLRQDVKEVYLSRQLSPTQFIDIGRINIKNGVATGFNPTDYFKVGTVIDRTTEDVSQLQDARLGTLVLKGQRLWGDSALTLLVSPKVSDKPGRIYTDKEIIGLNLQKSNDRSRTMTTYTHKIIKDFSPEYIYYNESGNHNFGLNLNKALNKQWLSYVEWNVGKRRNLVDEALLDARVTNLLDPAVDQAFPEDQGEHYLQQLAIGTSYTAESDIITNLEYHYNEAGLSKTDAESFYNVASNTQNNPVAQEQLLSVRELARDRGEPFGQHTLFLRSSWDNAGIDDLNLTGLLFYDLSDNSHLIQAEISYELKANTLLLARLASYQGVKKSNYGSLGRNQSATLVIEYIF